MIEVGSLYQQLLGQFDQERDRSLMEIEYLEARKKEAASGACVVEISTMRVWTQPNTNFGWRTRALTFWCTGWKIRSADFTRFG